MVKKFHSLPIRQVLEFLKDQDDFVLLDTNKFDEENFLSYIFYNPLDTISANFETDLEKTFEFIEKAAQKHYLAGYFGYELGDLLHGLKSKESKKELFRLGIYKNMLVFNHKKGTFSDLDNKIKSLSLYQEQNCDLEQVELSIDYKGYRKAFEKIQDYIKNGYTYQVNFTDKLKFKFKGDINSLYLALRKKQKVSYSALIKHGKKIVLSFSPELFIRRQQDQLMTKPMKGTAKRGKNNLEDQKISNWLANDPKNQAENIMIIDLIRNDLGRISKTGSVEVKDKFKVEKFETLFQMTSTIQSELKENISYFDIFKSIFPCGSVTGAPKLSTMKIIKELEKEERGVYTGAIGFMMPNKMACFNVPIRTIVIENEKGEMGVGSGITNLSEVKEEYEETLLKGKFLTDPPVDFRLIETMLWDNGFKRLDIHLKRMQESSVYFGFAFEKEEILQKLAKLEKTLAKGVKYRVRLLLDQTGASETQVFELEEPENGRKTIAISKNKVNSNNIFQYHKTTNRNLYNEEYEKYHNQGFFDVIFLNEKGQVAEASRANIFIRKWKKLYTPKLSCGILNGTYRQYLLSKNKGIIETELELKDLLEADKVYLTGATKEMCEVEVNSP